MTHALLPAVLATPLLPRSRRGEFYGAAGIVALGGAIPDLVNPHLSLAARYASWSHSLLALGGFGAVLVVVRTFAPSKLPWRVATLAWLAFALHVFGDAVSGGVALYRPFSAGIVRPPTRWIPYRWWWPLDGACVLAAAIIAAARPWSWGGKAAPSPGAGDTDRFDPDRPSTRSRHER